MDLKGTVVFSSGKLGDYDIWTLDLQTKQMNQLTSGKYWNDCPKWSPDGENIVFVSNRTGTPEIWIMNQDGSNQQRLTSQNRWHNTPDWSPDGQSIVCCANYNGNIDIYTMKADGQDITQITDYEGIDFTPQFSPDGKFIVFASKRTGNDDIWLYDIASKKLKQLTDDKLKSYAPAFSPDGSTIAFISGGPWPGPQDLEYMEIFFMNRDGSEKRPVTKNLGVDQHVQWSPDGKYLIYTSNNITNIRDKLQVLEVKTLKAEPLNFDRKPLEREIGAIMQGFLLFQFLPENILRKFYPETFWGAERYPDWKF